MSIRIREDGMIEVVVVVTHVDATQDGFSSTQAHYILTEEDGGGVVKGESLDRAERALLENIIRPALCPGRRGASPNKDVFVQHDLTMLDEATRSELINIAHMEAQQEETSRKQTGAQRDAPIEGSEGPGLLPTGSEPMGSGDGWVAREALSVRLHSGVCYTISRAGEMRITPHGELTEPSYAREAEMCAVHNALCAAAPKAGDGPISGLMPADDAGALVQATMVSRYGTDWIAWQAAQRVRTSLADG